MPSSPFRALISLLFAPLLAFVLYVLVPHFALNPAEIREALFGQSQAAEIESMASAAGKNGVEKLNVLKTPLKIHSLNPLTGFFRDGYCRTTPSDSGHHAVAGIVSDEFLAFSASKGNDLRTIGLTGGCKWCLCTGRWLEAFRAFERGEVGEGAVPRVVLEATEDSVLEKLKGVEVGGLGGVGVLEKFRAEEKAE